MSVVPTMHVNFERCGESWQFEHQKMAQQCGNGFGMGEIQFDMSALASYAPVIKT